MYVVEKHGDVYTLMKDEVLVKGDMTSREEADRWKKLYENRDAIQVRKPALAEKLAKWREYHHNARIARQSQTRRTNKK